MVQPQALTQPVSFASEDLAEGGGPPVQQNLTIQSALFVDWDYGGKAPMITALKLDLANDAGQVNVQYYSVGDPQRIRHANGGRTLTAPPTKTSNFGILMAALGNAGFPQSILAAGDITALNGLYAYWDAATVSRAGLPGGDGGARQMVVAVPTQIFRLPGQQAAAVAAPAAPAAPAPAPPMAGGLAPAAAPAPAPAVNSAPLPAPAPVSAPLPAPAPAPAAAPSVVTSDVGSTLVALCASMPAPTFLQAGTHDGGLPVLRVSARRQGFPRRLHLHPGMRPVPARVRVPGGTASRWSAPARGNRRTPALATPTTTPRRACS